MSRSGYSDDIDDPLALGRWRSAVRNALNGKRGQAFLKEMLAALDALPEKRLVAHDLEVPITGMPFALKGGERAVRAQRCAAAAWLTKGKRCD